MNINDLEFTPIILEENHPCYDCTHYDESTGMCASHEGCVRDSDMDINNY